MILPEEQGLAAAAAAGKLVQFPAAPWRLRGEAVLQLQLLVTAQVRPLVPAALEVVSVAPGRTLGAVYLASYQAGSTRQYHELIVIPALVRQRHRLGGWISHIYVDDEISALAGREIWALPKRLAAFQREYGARGAATVVRQRRQVLCVFEDSEPVSLGRLPVFAPAYSRRENKLLWFRGSGSARWGLGSGAVRVPLDSPFAALGFGRGRRLHLDELDISMHAPRS
jgi:hypothetical protein